MLKPNSLREHLVNAVPAFRTDPDKLAIYARNGRLVCAGARSLSFEYHYTLNIVVLDYALHADTVMVPVLAWLQRHQPEIFDNEALRQKAVRFEVEYLTANTVDLSVEIDLTERVLVSPRGTEPGHFDIKHVGEPPREGIVTQAEHWELWFMGEKMAEWDYDPR